MLHKVEELLHVVCPSCSRIIDPTPNGCIAMRCAHCSKAFCWCCFQLAPSGDAHAHAMSEHGSYFPPLAYVAAWHRRMRWLGLTALLGKRLDPADRASALEAIGAVPLLASHRLWPLPETAPAPPMRIDAFSEAYPPTIRLVLADDGLDALQAALDAGEDIDSLDDRGMSALMHASHAGKRAAVELLLRGGADASLLDVHSCGALSYACREGHFCIAGLLVRACTDRGAVGLLHEIAANRVLPFLAAKLRTAAGVGPLFDAIVRLGASICDDAGSSSRAPPWELGGGSSRAARRALSMRMLSDTSLPGPHCYYGWTALTWAAHCGALPQLQALVGWLRRCRSSSAADGALEGGGRTPPFAIDSPVESSPLGAAWREGHMRLFDWLLAELTTREGWARELRHAAIKEMLTGQWLGHV